MNALSALISFYNSRPLNDTYRSIAFHMLGNIRAVPVSSSYQMAELCFTVPPNLRRLAIKIGYKTYTDFRTNIKFALDNYHFLNEYRLLDNSAPSLIDELFIHVKEMAARTQNAIDDAYLTRVVAELRKCARIALFVSETTYQIGRLQADLLMDGHRVSLLTGLHDQWEQAAALEPGDFAVFIRPDIPPHDDVRALALRARASGAATFIISNSTALIENAADYVLMLPGSSSLLDAFMIDMLVAAVVVKHQELYSRTPRA